MPSVAVLAADGFETIERLTMVVDVMRRGGVRATLVSIMPTREVVSSLQIPVTCDALFDEINLTSTTASCCPATCPVPGTCAPISASATWSASSPRPNTLPPSAPPRLSGRARPLEGRHATCFHGFEKASPKAPIPARRLRAVGNIITASSMAQSLPFCA